MNDSKNATRALVMATLAMLVSFAVWGLISSQSTRFQAVMGLSDAQTGFIIDGDGNGAIRREKNICGADAVLRYSDLGLVAYRDLYGVAILGLLARSSGIFLCDRHTLCF